MGRELEYKFRATPQILERMAAAFGPMRQIRMQTTYFDTPDRRLSAQNCTLRLRQENEESICTFKTPLPDGSRGEWECRTDRIAEGISGIPQAAALIGQETVVRVCGARFVRLATTVSTDDATAELALDSGVLLGREQEIPLCEVEVEYRSGSEQAAAEFARRLAEMYGLQEEKKSKFARAIALADAENTVSPDRKE